MTEMTHEKEGGLAGALAAPRRGIAISGALALLVAAGCFFSWANIDLLVLHRSYAGTHFGAGQLTLALALGALALTAATVFGAARLVYALPLVAATTLAVTAWKYQDVANANSPLRGFHLTTVTVGGGLLLALIASALLLGGSLLAVIDHVKAAQRRSASALEAGQR